MIRTVIPHDSYWELYNMLDSKIQEKIDFIILVLQTQKHISKKQVDYLTNSCGIYEIRTNDRTKEYRFLFFFTDEGDMFTGKEILLCKGFIKKDNKDYIKPIEDVEAIKDQLLKNKNSLKEDENKNE